MKDEVSRLNVVKTSLSECLLGNIKSECEARKLKFSDFMRDAAQAALRRVRVR